MNQRLPSFIFFFKNYESLTLVTRIKVCSKHGRSHISFGGNAISTFKTAKFECIFVFAFVFVLPFQCQDGWAFNILSGGCLILSSVILIIINVVLFCIRGVARHSATSGGQERNIF